VREKDSALDAGLHIFGPNVLARLVFFIDKTYKSLGSSIGIV